MSLQAVSARFALLRRFYLRLLADRTKQKYEQADEPRSQCMILGFNFGEEKNMQR